MNIDDIIIPIYCILWALGGNIKIMGKEYCCISTHETLRGLLGNGTSKVPFNKAKETLKDDFSRLPMS